MISASERNLHEFYRCIGATGAAILAEDDDYSLVSGIGGNWPQMIFDADLTSDAGVRLGKIFDRTGKLNNVRFAVCNADYFTSDDQDVLRKGNIYPVDYWVVMETDFKSDSLTVQKIDHKSFKLTGSTEIDMFTGLVNSELLKGIKVCPSLFKELVENEKAEIYGLFHDQKLVCGLLSFIGKEHEAGLYFIVTDSRFRGQGLAADLIARVMKLLFERGFSKIVLQAVPKAVSLYVRLGFVPKNKLLIFWKQ